jgi:protein subunit release factor A
MLEQLRETCEHYDEISQKLADPQVIGDNSLYRTLMKEYKNLTPVVGEIPRAVRCAEKRGRGQGNARRKRSGR